MHVIIGPHSGIGPKNVDKALIQHYSDLKIASVW